jgi:hypothetical protein
MEQISPRSVTQKSLIGQSRDYALLAFNFVGAIVYVRFSSLSWAIPEEKGLHSQTGEPFIWALSVIPIFSLFFAVNAVWGVIILARRQWRSGYLWLLTVLIWIVAAMSDFAHH